MKKFVFSLALAALLSTSGVLYSITIYHVPTITVARLKNRLLVQTAAQGKENLALDLLALPGIRLSAQDKMGKTALHHAAEKGLTDLAKALMAKGADLQRVDSQGNTASDLALKAGHLELAKLLRP